ncbi:MAG: hypothetical protein D6732_17595 [Methanobacteriota archaeon]|nr:MAG: hypothetical protein D6732_17595 [Euryarchaeota archaeon]
MAGCFFVATTIGITYIIYNSTRHWLYTHDRVFQTGPFFIDFFACFDIIKRMSNKTFSEQRIINFILSGENPASLVKLGDTDLFRGVISMIQRDPDIRLAQTDPALYRKLRERITEYRIMGWGIPS